MPKSRVRRQAAYTPPPRQSIKKKRSAPWLVPVMLACFLLGVVWLATYYISGGTLVGQRALGAWNLVVGFGLIVAGFMFATRWR